MSSTAGAEPRRPRKIARPEETRAANSGRLAKPYDLALAAARAALSKKADDVVLLDLTGQSAVCDYFVIASGGSEPQVKAIAEAISEQLELDGQRVWHTEGYRARRWILLDYVDVIVHVFHRDTREVYQLERLWADARKEKLADE